MSGVPLWTEKYVRVPFSERGCWRLVHTVLREQAGIITPEHGDIDAKDYERVENEFVVRRLDDEWHLVTGPRRPFDVVMLTAWCRIKGHLRRREIHCGIMVTPALMLHVEPEIESCVISLDMPIIRGRVRGTYRHRDAQHDRTDKT